MYVSFRKNKKKVYIYGGEFSFHANLFYFIKTHKTFSWDFLWLWLLCNCMEMYNVFSGFYSLYYSFVF